MSAIILKRKQRKTFLFWYTETKFLCLLNKKIAKYTQCRLNNSAKQTLFIFWQTAQIKKDFQLKLKILQKAKKQNVFNRFKLYLCMKADSKILNSKAIQFYKKVRAKVLLALQKYSQ